MISAKVIADSKNEFGNRITTMVVTFPRIILAEFNTHRMFSRNSASSRAIPFDKMVEAVTKNPFIPIAWQKDHKGMQGVEYFLPNETFTSENPMDRFARGITDEDSPTVRIVGRLKAEWLWARDMAVQAAINLSNTGVHYHPDGDKSKLTGDGRGLTKQLCNRLLEPFMWHTVIVTATEWENFFALRCPQYQTPVSQTIEPQRSWKDLTANHSNPQNIELLETHKNDWVFKLQHNKGQAEIHMMALAEAMWDAYNESEPKQLKAGEWHIPFIQKEDWIQIEHLWHEYESKKDHPSIREELNEIGIKITTVRCARVSYTVVGEEGRESNYEKDIELHDRLAASGHWSCFEHCAQAMSKAQCENYTTTKPMFQDMPDDDHYVAEQGWCGNFRGFIQYRKMFNNENITV